MQRRVHLLLFLAGVQHHSLAERRRQARPLRRRHEQAVLISAVPVEREGRVRLCPCREGHCSLRDPVERDLSIASSLVYQIASDFFRIRQLQFRIVGTMFFKVTTAGVIRRQSPSAYLNSV